MGRWEWVGQYFVWVGVGGNEWRGLGWLQCLIMLMYISLILSPLCPVNKVNEQNLLHRFESSSLYVKTSMTLIAE